MRILQLSVQFHRQIVIGVLCEVHKFTCSQPALRYKLEGGRRVFLGSLILVWGKIGGGGYFRGPLQNRLILHYSFMFFCSRKAICGVFWVNLLSSKGGLL